MKKKMTILKFFKKLNQFYNGILGTNIACKFYCQVSTFSFELHNTNETCFTPKSLVFVSEAYWWGYDNNKDFEKIISDIEKQAKKLNILN